MDEYRLQNSTVDLNSLVENTEKFETTEGMNYLKV